MVAFTISFILYCINFFYFYTIIISLRFSGEAYIKVFTEDDWKKLMQYNMKEIVKATINLIIIREIDI